MVIRRGDVTDIAWIFAGLEMKCLISNQHYRVVNMAQSYHSCVLGSHKKLGSVAQI